MQHRKRDWIYIQKNSIELASKTGRAEGITEGITKGRKEGRDNATKKVVFNMEKKGMTLKTTAEQCWSKGTK